MKKACIIHGWGANSLSNWFSWLKEELEKKDFKVVAPDFPNTQFPILFEWLSFFERTTSVDENTILIGHSLGVPFILRFLESFNKDIKIKAAFLVSGFERNLGIPEIENFVDKPFDWNKIRALCKKFYVINSDDDPYIPLCVGEDLAKSLNAKFIVEHNGGHLNTPGGFFAYPKLLKLILEEVDEEVL